jgi:hypothetical protein
MIGQREFNDIVTTYEKHGWVLRRVLLSHETRRRLTEIPANAATIESDIDAAWFSRPPMAGEISWEIRSLGPTPFALVEFVDEDSPDFEDVLEAVKQRMIDSLSQRKRLDN